MAFNMAGIASMLTVAGALVVAVFWGGAWLGETNLQLDNLDEDIQDIKSTVADTRSLTITGMAERAAISMQSDDNAERLRDVEEIVDRYHSSYILNE
jgi:hypothetical protein